MDKKKRSPSPTPLEGAPADKKTRVLPPVAEWSMDDVISWALQVVKLERRHAEKLREQEIKGPSLLEMSRVDLERYGIPGGPAAELMKAIRELSPAPLPAAPGAILRFMILIMG